jgi:ATP-dependent Zn protease
MKNDLEKEITEQLHNSYITQKEKTTQILTEEIEDIELNSAIDIDKETNMKRNKKSKKFGEIGITFVSVIALLILLLIIQTKQKKK